MSFELKDEDLPPCGLMAVPLPAETDFPIKQFHGGISGDARSFTTWCRSIPEPQMAADSTVSHHRRIIRIRRVFSCHYKLAVDGKTFIIQQRM